MASVSLSPPVRLDSSALMQTSRRIKFEDNRILPLIFDTRNELPLELERRTGVQLSVRGNTIRLVGTSENCNRAESVLCALYERAQAGYALSRADIMLEIAKHNEPAKDDPFVAMGKLRPRNKRQSAYVSAMSRSDVCFALGPAGTGKTWLAVQCGLLFLQTGKVSKFVITRPVLEAGERIGFLPGDVRDKLDPYFRPIYDAIEEQHDASRVEKLLARGALEIAPLAFMRGRTLKNAFVLLDEAQNTTPQQMKMFLTRIGTNSQMVITGDPQQRDLPASQSSGLEHAVAKLQGLAMVEIVQFQNADVCRHAIVADILEAWNR